MDKDQQEIKKFLEQQVEWCKNRDSILAEMEKRLFEMKQLAESAHNDDLTSVEINRLNVKLNILNREVYSLEQQLQSIVH